MSLINCSNCGGQISDMAEFCPHCHVEVVKDPTEKYSDTIYNNICEFLDEDEYYYEKNVTDGILYIPRLGIDSPLKSVNVLIRVRESDYIISVHPDNFKISSQHLGEFSKLAMLINGLYYFPQLVVDYKHQNVIARHYCDSGDKVVDINEIRRNFLQTATHFDDCGKVLMSVSLGLQTAEEAFNSLRE